MAKNKITTQGYFIKRLRDVGFTVDRIYDRYTDKDIRKWTVMINPRGESLYITCCDMGEWPYKGLYEFDDAGNKFPKNFFINTDSIEVITKHLKEFGVTIEHSINTLDGKKKENST